MLPRCWQPPSSATARFRRKLLQWSLCWRSFTSFCRDDALFWWPTTSTLLPCLDLRKVPLQWWQIDLHNGQLVLLSQSYYTPKYRKTTDHGNVDALSRLLASTDVILDREEEQADTSIVYLVKEVSLQLDLVNPKLLAKESTKNSVIFSAMQHNKEGWPQTLDSEEIKWYRKLKN